MKTKLLMAVAGVAALSNGCHGAPLRGMDVAQPLERINSILEKEVDILGGAESAPQQDGVEARFSEVVDRALAWAEGKVDSQFNWMACGGMEGREILEGVATAGAPNNFDELLKTKHLCCKEFVMLAAIAGGQQPFDLNMFQASTAASMCKGNKDPTNVVASVQYNSNPIPVPVGVRKESGADKVQKGDIIWYRSKTGNWLAHVAMATGKTCDDPQNPGFPEIVSFGAGPKFQFTLGTMQATDVVSKISPLEIALHQLDAIGQAFPDRGTDEEQAKSYKNNVAAQSFDKIYSCTPVWA